MNDMSSRNLAADDAASVAAELQHLKAALNEHAILAITDAHGKIIHVNDNFCAISQYSRAELLGQDHRIINSGLHSREFMRDMWSTISQGRVWKGEVRNRAKDGSFYWMATTIMPVLGPDGKPVRHVSLRTDITARKQAEQELRALNEQLDARVRERTEALTEANRALRLSNFSVEHASVATFWVAPDARILRANEASCHLTGYSEEELLRMRVMDLDVQMTPEIWTAHWRELRERRHMAFEARQRCKDGSIKPIDVEANWMEFDGREFNFTFVRDISLRKRAEEALQRERGQLESARRDLAALNSELEERVQERASQVERLLHERQHLVRQLGHDLKTPLTPLLSLLPVLLEEEANPARHEMLELALEGARSIHAGVVRFLELCRLDEAGRTLDIAPQNLHALVESAIARCRDASEPGERLLSNEIPPGLKVQADARLLPEALVQILNNAVKFTGTCGRIRIHATHANDAVCLKVTDDGIGMESRHLERIFEPFYKTDSSRQRHGAPGLGLTIARTIAARHGGCLRAESGGLGCGTTLSLTLPAAAKLE
jgi:PAS domain S-box-containing protein